MILQRTLIAAVLIPIALLAVILGGIPFAVLISLLLAVSAWEYARLAEKTGMKPGRVLAVVSVLAIALGRYLTQFAYGSSLLTSLTLITAAYHLVRHERKPATQAADLGASLGIMIYVGWLGSYIFSLRGLPDGMWWLLLLLPIVWTADSGAFLIGTWFGSRPLSPHTSPNKTWEGYLASIVTGVLGGYGIAWSLSTWGQFAVPFTPGMGALLGLVISTTIPVGDLIESMLKRQADEKDSGSFFPGHGGVLDRLDSMFWAAPIGYYFILHILIP